MPSTARSSRPSTSPPPPNPTQPPTRALPLTQARQLYEMILVRHGLMLVGLPFGAKTSLYK